jgi:hypothetical protein
MRKPLRLTSRGKESRRYSLGETPCGNCQSAAHERCRPRLDGTLCTCSCERARIASAQFQRWSDAAQSAGSPQPTVAEALDILYPRLSRF